MKVFSIQADGTAKALSIQQVEGSPIAIEKGDFNKDGFTDLVLFVRTLASGFTLLPYLSHRDRTFTAQAPFVPNYQPDAPTSSFLRAGDLNSDGKLDLVVGRAVLFGNGDGTFREQAPLAGYPVVIAPFRSPGVLDLIVATASHEATFF